MSDTLNDLVSIVFEDTSYQARAQSFAYQFNFSEPRSSESLVSSRDTEYVFHFGPDGCFLSWWQNPRKPVYLKVNFTGGANAHRRLYGGGKGQAVAKAVGISAKFKPNILDATAGQGGDAFVFASLGCNVTMVERSVFAYQLLRDAIDRGLDRAMAGDIVGEQSAHDALRRMSLYFNDSLHPEVGSAPWKLHDVVYLDPMFPEKKKSAAVKKEMRIFHDLIGADNDSDKLLDVSRDLARYRVVVKRSKAAPFLADEKPTYQITGKSTRFDVYVNKALP